MPPKKEVKSVAGSSTSKPFVSVLTPTYNRRRFIPTLIQVYKDQTYPLDRMEWIILDDGEDKVGDLFEEAAKTIPNIRYIALSEKKPIGAKRNILNAEAKGDICVCLDDDDYYPPHRVSKAVFKLQSVAGHTVPVVGASEIFLFFADRDEIWSIGPYNQNHCTNGTMAYWTSYGKANKYDDTAEKAEERVFMKDWKTPVLQLLPSDTMLVICHAENTFDKRILLQQNNPKLKKQGIKMKDVVQQKTIKEFYRSLAAEYRAKPLPPPKPIAPTIPPQMMIPGLFGTPQMKTAMAPSDSVAPPVVAEAPPVGETTPTHLPEQPPPSLS